MILDLDVRTPGPYSLWLSEIEIQASPDGQVVPVNGFLRPWDVHFSQEDLDRESKTISAPAGGVFRITVVDGQGNAVPDHKLLAYAANTALPYASEATIEISMGGDGTCVVYDNPTQCVICIDPGFGVLIEHLNLVLQATV